MGNQHDGALRAAHGADAAGDDLERVDVEAGVGLVENGEPGFQHRHLQNLVALLFATGEAFVHRAVKQAWVHLHEPELVLDQREKVHGIQFRFAAMLADRVEPRLEQIDVRDAGDFHRILEGQEDARACPLFGRHAQQVRAVVEDFTRAHDVAVPPGQHMGKGALAGAVGAHDGVHLPSLHGKVDAVQDGLVVD